MVGQFDSASLRAEPLHDPVTPRSSVLSTGESKNHAIWPLARLSLSGFQSAGCPPARSNIGAGARSSVSSPGPGSSWCSPRPRQLSAKSPGKRRPLLTRQPPSQIFVEDHRPRFITVQSTRDRGHHSSTARPPKRLVHGDTIMASPPNRHVLPSETLTTPRPPGDCTNAHDVTRPDLPEVTAKGAQMPTVAGCTRGPSRRYDCPAQSRRVICRTSLSRRRPTAMRRSQVVPPSERAASLATS